MTYPAALAGVIIMTILARSPGLDQPIVENYVGRQIPTAMVARNLERGGDFFHPRLDTAPFPNYFLVEPPVYQTIVVALRRLTGWPLGASGRFVSAVATAVGVWGLFGLVHRREGPVAALASCLVLALLPVTLRYGRAFQPDALMLGAILGGLNGWDRAATGRRWAWAAGGWGLLACGLACKVLAAWVFVPLFLVILRRARWPLWLGAISTLLPVLAWYGWATWLLGGASGSRASSDNRDLWLSSLGFAALTSIQTLHDLGRFLLIRAFTPLGFALAVWGLIRLRATGEMGDLWRVWILSALVAMGLVAGKLHHEYYWLSLAPAVAVGAGRTLIAMAIRTKLLAAAAVAGFVIMAWVCSRSTWQVPEEWRVLPEAGHAVQTLIGPGEVVIAPEPLLFEADRRGCRLEFSDGGARRAAGEWNHPDAQAVVGPVALIEFYRARGARYVADVGAAAGDERRKALHESIRKRYKVLMDQPSVIIADLSPPGPPTMATEDRPVTISDFAAWKRQGRRISVLTAYDFPTARLLDEAGIDCLLVGDSMGTTVQGRDTTLGVTLDQVAYHTEMVARGARRAFVVADLPFLSYQVSPRQAIKSAGRLLKETGCHAVKLEGGHKAAATIAALVDAEIPVMGHVGLTPQSVRRLGGYKVQRDEAQLRTDAQTVADAGAFAVVMECVPTDLAARITADLSIPTIGIGAGVGCDGQVLVFHDMLGIIADYKPRHARQYAELAETIRSAAARYISDVREGHFPGPNESFR